MDEYIKREDAIKHLIAKCIVKYPISFGFGLQAAVKELRKIPTAYVAPKSEVEKQKRKQDVMLLDAIDTFRNLLCIESYLDYEDTRKHYVVSIDDVNRIHAELKKKYTERCPDCKHFVGCECFDGKTCDEYERSDE